MDCSYRAILFCFYPLLYSSDFFDLRVLGSNDFTEAELFSIHQSTTISTKPLAPQVIVASLNGLMRLARVANPRASHAKTWSFPIHTLPWPKQKTPSPNDFTSIFFEDQLLFFHYHTLFSFPATPARALALTGSIRFVGLPPIPHSDLLKFPID